LLFSQNSIANAPERGLLLILPLGSTEAELLHHLTSKSMAYVNLPLIAFAFYAVKVLLGIA
jgi:hypothetical protein